ncbi:MAG: hypothetical protein IKT73_03930, partial [Anaerotignum sp.]|nr:hypothetical protein [Anaerotignum sp.]
MKKKRFLAFLMSFVLMLPAIQVFAGEATFKVVDAQEYTAKIAEDMKDDATVIAGPELQMKIVDIDSKWNEADSYEFTLDFENAAFGADFAEGSMIEAVVGGANAALVITEEVEAEDTSITLELTEESMEVEPTSAEQIMLVEKDIIAIDMEQFGLVLTSDKVGTVCTVEVSGDFGDSDALVFASILEEGVRTTLKRVAVVGTEEVTALEKDLKIEALVDRFCRDQVFKLKLTEGFEFASLRDNYNYVVIDIDENVATIELTYETDEFVIAANDMTIEAVDAAVGDICTITVEARGNVIIDGVYYGCNDCVQATADPVEAVKVIAEEVRLSVDEDEDIPVLYSGVNRDNHGLTSDNSHRSVEVFIEESLPEAWDLNKAFTISLPEGVYVVGYDGVEFTTEDN